MFFDVLRETGDSIARNKLRVALTGFSIAWGIFMLIVLLGAGNGLLHGVMHNFGSQSHNTMQLWGGYTSKEWKGQAAYREIKLDASHFEAVLSLYDDIIESFLPCIQRSVTASIGNQYQGVTLTGFPPEYLNTADIKVVAGRWINDLDMKERRKVVVLEERTLEGLGFEISRMPTSSTSSATSTSSTMSTMTTMSSKSTDFLGQYIRLGDIMFQIVGIYRQGNSRDQEQQAYAPFSTMAAIYNGSEFNLSNIRLTLRSLDTAEANADFEEKLKQTIARIENYDPTDNGIWVWNQAEDYLQTLKIFNGLQVFIWIIGLASLIAGVVGISNIMLITVRERTREFGIRKAIGAKPRSILGLVLIESVAITLIFGYVGMFVGIGLTQLVDAILTMMQQQSDSGFSVFRNPTVDIGIVIGATIVMVIAGLIAGYIPARRAVKIKPVEAFAE